jgi:hypothetical protein
MVGCPPEATAVSPDGVALGAKRVLRRAAVHCTSSARFPGPICSGARAGGAIRRGEVDDVDCGCSRSRCIRRVRPTPSVSARHRRSRAGTAAAGSEEPAARRGERSSDQEHLRHLLRRARSSNANPAGQSLCLAAGRRYCPECQAPEHRRSGVEQLPLSRNQLSSLVSSHFSIPRPTTIVSTDCSCVLCTAIAAALRSSKSPEELVE